MIDLASGLVAGAHQLPSPNYDERPEGAVIDLLVVHAISLPPGEFGGPHIDRLFTNQLDPTAHPYFEGLQDLRVSAHLLVRRDGTLVQYVPLHKRAWHAGASCFGDRERCNDFSIGIELEGDDYTPFTTEQYRVLGSVCRQLLAAYPALHHDRIVGHSDIAPGRKTDPGPYFDWVRLHQEIQRPSSDARFDKGVPSCA